MITPGLEKPERDSSVVITPLIDRTTIALMSTISVGARLDASVMRTAATTASVNQISQDMAVIAPDPRAARRARSRSSGCPGGP